MALARLALPNKTPAPYNLSFTFKEQTVRRNRPRGFPSHEIHSLTPFHWHPLTESTPKTCKQVSSADAFQTPNHVPTMWFLTTSLVYASIKVTSLLRPATSHRVHAVWSVLLPYNFVGTTVHSTTRWVRTLLRIPLVSSAPRLRRIYPLTIYTRKSVTPNLDCGFPQAISKF